MRPRLLTERPAHRKACAPGMLDHGRFRSRNRDRERLTGRCSEFHDVCAVVFRTVIMILLRCSVI
jgi:hypothetical protein